MSLIPDALLDLLTSNYFGHLATVSAQGVPQVTPVWFRWVNGKLEVNSAKGRLKDRNMRANPHVAMSIMDPTNSYRYLELRGKVVEITEVGADEMIDQLAKAYMGVEKYPYHQPGDQRVRYVIEVTKFTTM
jgi:hypothetical protein